MRLKEIVLTSFFTVALLGSALGQSGLKEFSSSTEQRLKGRKVLYVERDQYANDHHNTATLFQYGEINSDKFSPGASIKIFDIDTKVSKVLIETTSGVVRDPEISFCGKKVIFSMRKDMKDDYHIYEMNIDGSDLRQITFAKGVSDIDPLYLPDGGVVFSSTRDPKYCMCNRHIMANLFRMNLDGSNITQLGVSTLFEGHASLLNDGRIIYDRWEYVDRNFGDAQGLWTMNPDGTKHAIYYGNNTASPGGVIDARAIPGSSNLISIFGSCHDKPWGALTILDRRKGVDGVGSVVDIWPKESRELVGKGDLDSFKGISNFYEDPYALDENNFLVSRTIWFEKTGWNVTKEKMGIYFVTTDGIEELLIEGVQSLFDPILVEPRFMPTTIPFMRNFEDDHGTFYVQDVYEGTHMEGVERGAAKYIRVVESPPKRTWSERGWHGEGEHAPGVNWHSFETKRVLGVIPIEEDGSVSFDAPSGKHVYFQLLDKDMKMIQSMRSGVSLMPGETNGCIGCHEDRLTLPLPTPNVPMALKKRPITMDNWAVEEPVSFSFMEQVQPILNKRCVSCHDFDKDDRDKLVLAEDMNPFFNAAYVNIYMKKAVTLIGAGPADLQPAYTWGSHKSLLTQVIDNKLKGHKRVRLTDEERVVLYTWMDMNGVYYPVYETAFDNTVAGRSPLFDTEIAELIKLTGVDFYRLNSHQRKLTAQISFDRPSESICLDSIRGDKAKFDVAVAIIALGAKRLKETPRGDIESDIIVSERNKMQLENYTKRLQEDIQNSCNINIDEKKYDKK